MEPSVFPSILYTRILGSFLAVIQSLHNSIDKKDYCDVVLYTTIAIDQMKPSPLLQAFLDVRAHAYFVLGRINAALEDAQRMVDCAPTSAVGYLRTGYYLSLYGQHKRAAEIYEQGLLNAQADREEMDLLAKGKSAEAHLSARKVDFIAALPIEVTMQIISQLPQDTVAICLTVSNTWRQRTLNCENVWTDLSVTEDLTSAPFINVTPYMGCHVKHLTLDVASDVANAVCMQKLREGHFTKLVSLKMTAFTTQNLQSYFDALSFTFWQAKSTLTTLNLDLDHNSQGITLAEILLSCSYVTDVIYSTKAPMSQLGGDFSLLENDHPLTNLELAASTITGTTIDDMVQRCQQLRRLVMNGCDVTVFSPITIHTPPHLQILAYNPDFKISSLQKFSRHQSGLRKIYTNNGGTRVDAMSVLPLIYKSRATLESIYVNLTDLTNTELQQLYTNYTDFTFPKVFDFTFWSYRVIQSFMLQTIRDTTTLTYLYAINVYDVTAFAKTMMTLPPVKELQLAHVHTTTSQCSLISLLERYARLSSSQSKVLESIILRSVDEITDEVLDALGDVKTVNQVNFEDLKYITTEGITRFIEKRRSKLMYIKLSGMEAITDNTVVALGRLKKLGAVNLTELQNVTDRGVRGMINGPRFRVSRFTIKDCDSVTRECIDYAKIKIKIVVDE